MFEQITDKRFKEALEVVNTLRDYSTETIISSDLNDFTKSFLVNDGDKYTTKEELIKVVEKSIKLNLNYCLRPTWTLINYLFGNFDSRQKADIQKRADIFIYYSFYTETIKEITNDEHYISIKRSLIDGVIRQINADIYSKLTTDITSLKIKNLFLQLFKLKYGDNVEVSLDMSIPYIFIKMFLEDKGYDDLVAVFVKAGFTRDNEEIELKTIIKVLTGKINSINEVYKGTQGETEEIIQEEEISGIIKDPVINTPEKIETGKEQENTYSDTITKEGFSTAPNISDEFEEKDQLQEKHLRFHFKDEEIKTIAKKVFKGNKYVLLDSFLEMEKLKSWREATEYLKEIFINNKVNIGDKSVITFVDVLNDYFEKR
jgi:hypothetical protein